MKLAAAIAAAAAPAVLALSAGPAPAPGDGERAYQKCYSCHSLEPGQMLEGPDLDRIVARPVAARAGFDYSPALQRLAETSPTWTPELLDSFIADPEAVVPGTTMAFAGIRDAEERAALIAFLERRSKALD